MLSSRTIQSFHLQTSSSGGGKHIQTSNHTLTWRRGWSSWAKLSVSKVVGATLYPERHLHILTIFLLWCLQNRSLFSTYVVASGLQYGMGEQILHYFFKVGTEKWLVIVLIASSWAVVLESQVGVVACGEVPFGNTLSSLAPVCEWKALAKNLYGQCWAETL